MRRGSRSLFPISNETAIVLGSIFNSRRYCGLGGLPLQINAVNLSSYAGLIAVGLLTANILLGLLQSVKYNTQKNGRVAKLTSTESTTGRDTHRFVSHFSILSY